MFELTAKTEAGARLVRIAEAVDAGLAAPAVLPFFLSSAKI